VEHVRTKNGIGETFQWVDSALHAVMDTTTGEFYRLEGGNSMGALSQCLDRVKQSPGWENRLVIVKIDCIRAFKVERS
jgi:hypothetical protein